MYISHQRKFLFCHVPRTGGTSICEYIRSHVEDADLLQFHHLSMREARAILKTEFTDFYKFAIVRNPWERMVSWYGLQALINVGFDKSIEIDHSPDSAHWQKFDKYLEEKCFLKVEAFRGDWLRNSQWQQLTDGKGILLVDEIGRFEKYVEGVQTLVSKIAAPEPFELALNASRHLHYSQYYSDFGRQLIEEVFHEDMVNLGYQFETA